MNKPPLCKGRWHGEAVTEGLSWFRCMHDRKMVLYLLPKMR